MTDTQTLFQHRLHEAEETLADAKKMQQNGISARSVVNRAYYSMFYGVLALFLSHDITHKTSKHSGVISFFDQMFVKASKLSREYSKVRHRIFEVRQESDYREMTQITPEEAEEYIQMAEFFLQGLYGLIREQDKIQSRTDCAHSRDLSAIEDETGSTEKKDWNAR